MKNSVSFLLSIAILISSLSLSIQGKCESQTTKEAAHDVGETTSRYALFRLIHGTIDHAGNPAKKLRVNNTLVAHMLTTMCIATHKEINGSHELGHGSGNIVLKTIVATPAREAIVYWTKKLVKKGINVIPGLNNMYHSFEKNHPCIHGTVTTCAEETLRTNIDSFTHAAIEGATKSGSLGGALEGAKKGKISVVLFKFEV